MKVATHRRSTATTVELWNPGMTARYPNIDREIIGLRFASVIYGGFVTCEFDLHRLPWRHYADLTLDNKVIVRSRHQIVWQGSIAAPGVSTTDLKLSIEADGPLENLGVRLALVNLLAGAKGSAWITANIIGVLGYGAGNIYGSDYAFPADLDFSDCYFTEAMDKINQGDNYRYGFFMPPLSNRLSANLFDFWPISSTPEYYLDMADCDTDIQFTKEGIENVLRVKYSTDGSTYNYFWWPKDGGGNPVPDATSLALYGRRDGKLDVPGISTLAQAQQLATVALAWRKSLRPASDIVARRITNINGVEIPLPEVQPGRVLHIRGLNPGKFTLLQAQSINELSTWPIVMSAPDIDAANVTLSPGGLGNTLEKLLTRAEMKAR